MLSSTKTPSAVVLLTILSLCQTTLATTSCYFPNGDLASTYVPCSSNDDGNCCAPGDFCTQWGYCLSESKGYHYRGACTDNTWANPSCPDYCLSDDNSGNSTVVDIIACNAASTSGSWCCAYNGNCCSSSTFNPTFGTIFAELGSSSTLSGPAATTSSPASTTSSSSASSKQTSSSTSVSNAVTASYVAQTSPAASASSKSNTGTIVGAAVGVPLGIIAIAGLVLFFLERKKRKQAELQQMPDEKTGYTYFGGNPPEGGMQGRADSTTTAMESPRGNGNAVMDSSWATDSLPTTTSSHGLQKPYELSSVQNQELPTDSRY